MNKALEIKKLLQSAFYTNTSDGRSLMHLMSKVDDIMEETDECVRKAVEIVNSHWSFDEDQQHTHSWHDKQDCLEALGELVEEQTKVTISSVEEITDEQIMHDCPHPIGKEQEAWEKGATSIRDRLSQSKVVSVTLAKAGLGHAIDEPPECNCMNFRWEVRSDGNRYCTSCGENKTNNK